MIKRLPYAVIQWALCACIKAALWIVGLVAVPLSLVGDGRKRTPSIFWLWGNDEKGFRNQDFDSVWKLYLDRCFRNPVGNHNYLFDEPNDYQEYGEPNLESKDGVQWRYRHTKYLDSFRVTFGKRRAKGKKEIYIGWKIGSSVPGLGFTTQARLF